MTKKLSKFKPKNVTEEVVHEQNFEEVIRAVSDNREAILKGIDLLETMNQRDTLDMLNSFVKSREKSLERVMRELSKPENSALMEHLTHLILTFGKMETNELQHFAEKMNTAAKEAAGTDGSGKTSYMDLIKALKDPKINRSITVLLKFLRSMGKV